MKYQKFNYAIIMSLICIFILLIGAVLYQPSSTGRPLAVNGVLDLSKWDFGQTGSTYLNGEWDFYWQHLLTPQDLSKESVPTKTGTIKIPRAWNDNSLNGEKLSPNGYATFRLKLHLKNQNELYALKLPKVSTAYKLWIDDHLVASAGKVGMNENEMIPEYLPQVVVFKPESETTQVVLQVSNFMFKDAGIWEKIEIGTDKQIDIITDKKLAFDMFLFGALFITACYHFILFIYRQQEKANLYFGLFCILLAIRVLLLGETFLTRLCPSLNWEVALKIEFLTYYLAQPLYIIFTKSLFPQDVPQRLCDFCNIVGGIFELMVLATTANVYTRYLYLYQISTFVVAILWSYFIIKAVLRKREGSIITIIGGAILLFTAVSDILYYNDIRFINDFFDTDGLCSLGVLIFIFLQSCNLSRKFSLAFVKIEEMSKQMKELNENLEAMVVVRTAALQEASNQIRMQKTKLEEANHILKRLSILDGLTNIANRRHFDEVIEDEWERCLKLNRPLSLIFIDIDYFKKFNDNYGHQAGDDCLIKVASTLKETFTYEQYLVARYGGEEFVVVLPNTDASIATALAECIRNKIEKLKIPHEYSAISRYLSISLGVAMTIPDSKHSVKELIQEADTALYEAKNTGRNKVKARVLTAKICSSM